jgi:transposase
MVTVSRDRKRVLMAEFMQQGTTITSEVYCETLKKLRRAIQNKRRGMLTSGIVLHDNACRHTSTAARTRALLEHFSWELCGHRPYSPVLASSDYHLFTYLENWFGSQRINNKEELMEGVETWLSSQAADFFDTGIQTFIPRYKCLSSGGDYIEKYLKYARIFVCKIVSLFLVNSFPDVTFRIARIFSLNVTILILARSTRVIIQFWLYSPFWALATSSVS